MGSRPEIDRRSEAYRARIRELMRRKARERETDRRNPRSVDAVAAPSSMEQAVELVSGLQGTDARDAVDQLRRAPTLEAEAVAFAEDVARGDVPFDLADYMLRQVDMEYFAECFLPHHFTNRHTHPRIGEKRIFHPDFHGDLARMFSAIAYRRVTTPLVVAGFPESGKTTMCSLLFPIHNICHGGFVYTSSGEVVDLTKRFHLYVSAVETNARRLMNGVLEEFESNQALVTAYGPMYHDPHTGKKGSREWAVNKATTTNGVHLEARSRRGKFRTLKWRQYRPDLGIADDIETDDGVLSRSERDKMIRFFFNVFMPRFAQDRGNVIILGNLLDEQSLMAQLVRHGAREGWETRIYRLYEMDERGEKVYLMPDHYGERYEREKREQLMGDSVVFRQEYLQDPAASDAELRLDDFAGYERDHYYRIEGRCYKYMAVDPAASPDKRADYTAIGGVAYDPETGLYYAMPAVEAKLAVGDQIDALATYYVRNRPWEVGVEAVGYQKVLAPLLEDYCAEQGFTIDVREVKQDARSKYVRIRRLFPWIKAGRLLFDLESVEHQHMRDQLICISRRVQPDYDDLADMLEMAVRLRDEEAMEEFADGESGVGGDIGTERGVVRDPAVAVDGCPRDADAADADDHQPVHPLFRQSRGREDEGPRETMRQRVGRDDDGESDEESWERRLARVAG